MDRKRAEEEAAEALDREKEVEAGERQRAEEEEAAVERQGAADAAACEPIASRLVTCPTEAHTAAEAAAEEEVREGRRSAARARREVHPPTLNTPYTLHPKEGHINPSP